MNNKNDICCCLLANRKRKMLKEKYIKKVYNKNLSSLIYLLKKCIKNIRQRFIRQMFIRQRFILNKQTETWIKNKIEI